MVHGVTNLPVEGSHPKQQSFSNLCNSEEFLHIRGPILIWNGELTGHKKICASAVFAQIKITLPAAHCECFCDCKLTVIANDIILEHTWKQFMSRWTSDCPSTCFHEVGEMRGTARNKHRKHVCQARICFFNWPSHLGPALNCHYSGKGTCSVNCECFKFDCVTTTVQAVWLHNVFYGQSSNSISSPVEQCIQFFMKSWTTWEFQCKIRVKAHQDQQIYPWGTEQLPRTPAQLKSRFRRTTLVQSRNNHCQRVLVDFDL